MEASQKPEIHGMRARKRPRTFRVPAIFASERIPRGAREIHKVPRVLSFEKFLTPVELQHFLRLAAEQEKFCRSQVLNEDQGNFVDNERTSSSCYLKSDAILRRVQRRVAKLCSVSEAQAEAAQMVRYQANEHFGLHHDSATILGFDEVQLDAGNLCKRRVLTCLVYLTTNESGDTCFPKLELKVQPQAGAALLWSNFTHAGEPDLAVIHEAAPLVDGVKFALNLWFLE